MRRILLSVCAVLAALAMGACQPHPPFSFRNTDITGAEFGRALSLTDHGGRLRSLDDFRGKAIVLFFGYTSCPDVCPTALAKFAAVPEMLGDDAGRVQVLFVTLDPERDTQEVLAAYVPWFHPTFIGLRGDAAATLAVAREFKVFWTKKEVGGGLGYVLDHTAGAYVFDPAGRIRLFVRDDAASDAIAADLRALLAGR